MISSTSVDRFLFINKSRLWFCWKLIMIGTQILHFLSMKSQNQNNTCGFSDECKGFHFTSWLSAPLASTPIKYEPSGDVPGRKICQRGSPVTSLASPVIVKFRYITVFLLFPGEKWLILFPGENFKVHWVTWSGCRFSTRKYALSYHALNFFDYCFIRNVGKWLVFVLE